VTIHNGLPVAGYQPQSSDKIAIVNANKELEERVLRVIDDLTLSPQATNGRWLAIARTHIEEGFMALNRAVFQPGRVKLPEDN